MGPIRPILIAMLLCSACMGQTITPTKVNVTSGYTNPKVVGPYLLHGDFSAPTSRLGVLLTIESAKDQKLFDLYAEQVPTLDAGDLQLLPDGAYLLVGEGKYRITAYFENPSAVKRVTVELGPIKPPDPPKPDVVVPDDPFDNVGKRVQGWAVGLPKSVGVAALYEKCAVDLLETTLTINACIDKMVADRKALLTADELKQYQPLIDKLNEDLKKRWPMAAPVAASYFQAIAVGLRGAK